MFDRMFGKPKVELVKEPTQKELLEKSKKALLEKMEKDIERIAPSLVNICEKVESEKPDAMIFLDKSARIFAGPVKKYLQDTIDDQEIEQFLPAFYFYNDENINHAISNYKYGTFAAEVNEDIERKISEEFETLIGKKVFVVDETYSAGRTLRMWTVIARVLSEINPQTKINFFALTRDDKYDVYSEDELDEIEEFEEESDIDTLSPGELEFRRETLEHAEREPNFEFTIYETSESQLFSRYKDFQYVKDDYNDGIVTTEGINASLNRRKEGIKTSKIPHASSIEEQEIWNSHAFEMAKIAKQKTYERMKEVVRK